LGGLFERLSGELMGHHFRARVLAASGVPERRFCTWTGGSILATFTDFQKMWVSKEDYEEVREGAGGGAWRARVWAGAGGGSSLGAPWLATWISGCGSVGASVWERDGQQWLLRTPMQPPVPVGPLRARLVLSGLTDCCLLSTLVLLHPGRIPFFYITFCSMGRRFSTAADHRRPSPRARACPSLQSAAPCSTRLPSFLASLRVSLHIGLCSFCPAPLPVSPTTTAPRWCALGGVSSYRAGGAGRAAHAVRVAALGSLL